MRTLAPVGIAACLVCGAIAFAGAAASGSAADSPKDAITEASVRAHMDFLASDALNGRKSGSRDEWIAATYIGARMQGMGLEPLGDAGSFVQDVRMERSEVIGAPVLAADGFTATHGAGMTVSSLTGASVSGPLQVYRQGTPVTPGAALIVASGVVLAPGDTAKIAMLIAPEATGGRAGRGGAGRPLAVQSMSDVPARATIALGQEAYTALQGIPTGTVLTLKAETASPVVTHTWNAMGRLPGKSPELSSEVILLSAHLDHLGARAATPTTPPDTDLINNGADDDASGCIAVLELAQSLAGGPRPDRTVIFVCFGSEEAGGFGARHFIDAPPVPLEKIVANLEFEMLGRPDSQVPAGTLWLTGYERSDLGEELAKHGAHIVGDPHPEQNFFSRSDNIQLARRGVVAQTVSSFGLHTDYHRPSDEIKTIDFRHLTDSIRSMAEPVRWLASSTFKPQWKPGMRP